MRTKKVRIVSVDKRYMKEAYPFIPIFDDRMGAYITGQHIDPNDPSTRENLTRLEMENPSTISMEKRKRFPHIIIAEERMPLMHLRSFNLSVDETGNYINQKDAAEFNFFALHKYMIAPSKDQVKEGTHYFYIENLEAEAEFRLSKKKLRYEAEKFIREKANMSKYRDIALMLNYHIKEFRANVNAPESILEDKIVQACEEYPADVIKCFSEEAERDIFILRAEYNGLIVRKGDSFFDGSQYLGDSIEDIKKFVKTEDGSRYERRWASQLAKVTNEPKAISADKSRKERFESLVDKCSRFIITGFFDDALNFYQEAFTLDPENSILVTLKEQIDNGTKGSTIILDIANAETSEELSAEDFKTSLIEKYNSKNRQSLIATCRQLKFEVEVYTNLEDEGIRNLIIEYKIKESYDK